MSNPSKLLACDDDDFAGALLASAMNDRGSQRGRAQALAAFGAVGVELATSTAAASANEFAALASTGLAASASGSGVPAVTLAALAKWVATGVLAGGVSVGGLLAVQEPRATTKATPATVAEPIAAPKDAPEVAPPRRVGEVPAEPRADERRATPLDRDTARVPPLISEAAAAGVLPSSGAFPSEEPSLLLKEELSHLERARRLLASGATANALDELRRYEARFPRGALAKEATLIAVEVRLQQGDVEGARAVASRALALDSTSPHALRIKALLSKEGLR